MVTKKEKVDGIKITMQPIKELTVRLTDLTREPQFIFLGDDWCGRDIKIVLRHIIRAYKRHQLNTMKQAMVTKQEPVLQTTGAN